MFLNHLKIAWRKLFKDRVSGFTNFLGLSIGIGAFLLIWLWVNDELNFNHYHKGHNRIGQLFLNHSYKGEIHTSEQVAIPWAKTLRNEFADNFEQVALVSPRFQHVLEFDNGKFIRDGVYVESGFPALLDLAFLSKVDTQTLSKPHTIIIAESVAQLLFGSSDPVGKLIRFDNFNEVEVTGVFKDLPLNSTFHESKFFVSWDQYIEQNSYVRFSVDQWENRSFRLFAKIQPHTDFSTVSEKIKSVEDPHSEDLKTEAFLYPMDKWHLFSQFENGEAVGGRVQYVRLFSIIGLFILLLACINFINLSTARSENRAKEVGIRKTLGSIRSQLINQFLSESVLLTFLASLFALALVQINLPWFNVLTEKATALPLLNPIFWGGLLTFVLVVGIVAGIYPAFILSSFQPIQVFQKSSKTNGIQSLPRRVMVVFQFVVSVILIIGTLVVFQQIDHAKNREIGYNTQKTILIGNTLELKGEKTELFRNELLSTGVVEAVSHSSNPITDLWYNDSDFDWEGKPVGEPIEFGFLGCSPEFGQSVGWKIVEGRDFDSQLASDSAAIVINEAAASLIGFQDIINKVVRWGDRPTHVIGVVQDMVMESPWDPIKPTIFFLANGWVDNYTIKLQANADLETSLLKIQDVYERLSPVTPFEYQFMDSKYAAKFEAEERNSKIAFGFTLLAVFISCLGLFALSTFIAEQRTKEIGIRKVFGASVRNIVDLLARDYLRLVLLAFFIAIPLAWYLMEQWLMNYNYRISLSWQLFVFAGLLALSVALITVSIQSIRAALANPVQSLRNE